MDRLHAGDALFAAADLPDLRAVSRRQWLTQTLASSLNLTTLDSAKQTMILERAVSQEAIKM